MFGAVLAHADAMSITSSDYGISYHIPILLPVVTIKNALGSGSVGEATRLPSCLTT